VASRIELGQWILMRGNFFVKRQVDESHMQIDICDPRYSLRMLDSVIPFIFESLEEIESQQWETLDANVYHRSLHISRNRSMHNAVIVEESWMASAPSSLSGAGMFVQQQDTLSIADQLASR
jgi:hypothetical protein